MSQSDHCGFSQLFASVWNTFKSNYPRLLAIMVPFVLLALVMLVGRIAIGVGLTGDDSDIFVGQAASIVFWFLFSSIIMSPVFAYLLYGVVRRARQGSPSRAGRYGQIVVLMLMGNVCLLPGTAMMASGSADQFVKMELGWELITDALKLEEDAQKERAVDASGDEEAKKGARAQTEADLAVVREGKEKLQVQSQVEETSKNTLLHYVGSLVSIAGVIFLLAWLPWSAMALLDPEEHVSDLKSAIRRGREIAAGNLSSMVGVYLVIVIIAVFSFVMLILPAFFFGIPLALAMVPGAYLCMRGEPSHAEA
ncbi:MAG: hypothetical protein P8I74_08395 [Phycisphaerales bacterium]|nr:hypothetical protein [Phycisphaerales bacterium]